MCLTDEEIRLITEAVAQGRVRRIPRGQSGNPSVWKRSGRPVNRVVVRLVRTMAHQKLTDRQIARRIGKTRKAVERIRDRHGIPSGYWLAKRGRITGTPREEHDG